MKKLRENDSILTGKMRAFKLISFCILHLFTYCTPALIKKVEQIYEDGSPKVVSYYLKNEPKVLFKQQVYYANHQLRIEGHFEKDEKNGDWIYYYENGVIWSKGDFKKGKMDGFQESFHPNGKPDIKGTYKDGIRIGKWYFYKENGELLKEINYDE